jgi:glycosidase
MMELREKLKKRLKFIYKEKYSDEITDRIFLNVRETSGFIQKHNTRWDEKDIVLITYGDSIVDNQNKPLGLLLQFLDKYLKDSITFVHILPFFPYSSDDGFSVIDYSVVDPNLGNWDDIQKIAGKYKLMFDLVVNHISSKSSWFQNYLKGIAPEKDYFIEVNQNADLSRVVRPRSLPLLTEVDTVHGKKFVWTTFSPDQIDLNFKNPELLAGIIDIFLFYLRNGASMIRLDAIAFLWKEIGTNCLHLPETHEFVKLLRDITDFLSPSLILLTETNVPNRENLSYFGHRDEAHMVYQFSLPPLLLNTLFTEDSGFLTSWAKTLPELPGDNTFFNFTASHDGIGVRPLEGLIPTQDFELLIDGLKRAGARISTKRNSDGTDSPYEINVTYYDAMKGTLKGPDQWQKERFICSQAIMLAMKGVPAFYIHSLLGTHNYEEGVAETGANRTINRKKWQQAELYGLLQTKTEHWFILENLKKLIDIRKSCPAFHPDCPQEIHDLGAAFFCIARDGGKLISVSNISSGEKELDLSKLLIFGKAYTDLISGKTFPDNLTICLAPYQTIWLLYK